MRSLQLLDRKRSGLLVIDLQERFLTAVPMARKVIWNAGRLLRAARVFEVPAVATVQYPKGLGPLDQSLREWLPEPIDKMRFSAALEDVVAWIQQRQLNQIVVCGLETHVCVLQTVLDLLAHGVEVFVPSDAVATRCDEDHERGLQRMADQGATITTVESVLFEWCETAADANFKLISALVKQSFPEE